MTSSSIDSFDIFYCPMDKRTKQEKENKWNWAGGPGANNSVIGFSKWSNKRIINQDHYQESLSKIKNTSPLIGDLYRSLSGDFQYYHKFTTRSEPWMNFTSGAGGVSTYKSSTFSNNYGLSADNMFFWPDMKY